MEEIDKKPEKKLPIEKGGFYSRLDGSSKNSLTVLIIVLSIILIICFAIVLFG